MEGEKGLQGRMVVTTRREEVTEKVLLLELGQESRADREASANPGSLGEASAGRVRYKIICL